MVFYAVRVSSLALDLFYIFIGFLESLDDFYLLSSGMVMLQTTNSIFNVSLYELVKPQSLLAWQRVRVANMMSHSGREWAMNLAEQNSGNISVMSCCLECSM